MLTIGCRACGQPFTFLAQGEETGGKCPYCGADSTMKAKPLTEEPEDVIDDSMSALR
jgi:DNA-directed RNA polymerase subunit RPC12/RpoP